MARATQINYAIDYKNFGLSIQPHPFHPLHPYSQITDPCQMERLGKREMCSFWQCAPVLSMLKSERTFKVEQSIMETYPR